MLRFRAKLLPFQLGKELFLFAASAGECLSKPEGSDFDFLNLRAGVNFRLARFARFRITATVTDFDLAVRPQRIVCSTVPHK